MPRDHNEFADTLIATSFWSLCLSVQCHRHFILDSSIVLALKDTIQNKNRRLFSRLLSIMLLRRALDSNQRIPYDIGSLANCWFKPLTQPSLNHLFCKRAVQIYN